MHEPLVLTRSRAQSPRSSDLRAQPPRFNRSSFLEFYICAGQEPDVLPRASAGGVYLGDRAQITLDLGDCARKLFKSRGLCIGCSERGAWCATTGGRRPARGAANAAHSTIAAGISLLPKPLSSRDNCRIAPRPRHRLPWHRRSVAAGTCSRRLPLWHGPLQQCVLWKSLQQQCVLQRNPLRR